MVDTPDPSEARAWAVSAHGDQRYGDQPYVFHLDAVAAVLREFGVSDRHLLAAAYLHDIVEDTPVERAEVAARFGEHVAAMVGAVTDAPGDTRAERKAGTYARIAATPGATTVKLADRIANVRACWEARSHKLFTYHREYPAFRGALRESAPDAVQTALWAELDALLGWR